MLSQYTRDMLEKKYLELDLPDYTRQWVEAMLEGLLIQFGVPSGGWQYHDQDLHTQKQVGFLASLMDLDRDDRLEMLSIIVGFPLYYDGEAFPDAIPIAELPPEKAVLYPGPSSKDTRITKLMDAVLVDFYQNNPDAYALHLILGYESLTDKRAQKRAARFLARQAKADALAAKRAARLAAAALRATRKATPSTP